MGGEEEWEWRGRGNQPIRGQRGGQNGEVWCGGTRKTINTVVLVGDRNRRYGGGLVTDGGQVMREYICVCLTQGGGNS